MYSLFINGYSFDVELVGSVLCKLKWGEAAGLDGLSAEHLTNSHHPILSCIVYRLFNLIIGCGHVPSPFGQSYTVPIPKLIGCRTNSMYVDDFRGIAISPVISKVFEHCIVDRFKPVFATVDNQFGFEKGFSARMQSIGLLFGILLIALSLVAVQLIYVQNICQSFDLIKI